MIHQCENLMIPKNLLIPGHYYAGKCRQAVIARWNGTEFLNWRSKFGRTFIETISYWTPGGFFDEFKPLFDIGPDLPNEIPLEEP